MSVVAVSLVAAVCGCAVAEARDVVVTSFDGTPIVAHFFPAATLGPGQRAPTVLIGPGFAGRGTTTPDLDAGDRIGTATLRRDGFNVLSWDPRGFGGSGGVAQFDSPLFEARDMQALIGYVAQQPEALLDGRDDPRVGMSGSSYGGGIQYVTAALDRRVDAIVPDASWNSLVTGFAKDGAFKSGWLLQVCANGALYGVLDGITDGFNAPPGVETGSIAPQFRTLCLEGNVGGKLSPATVQWLAALGPGPLLSRIRAATLITQGTVDTLFPPGEAIANYAALRANGVPVKMMWYCGGHGTCLTQQGDGTMLPRAGLTWLRRWLKRDETVDTGPAFEWIDDDGTWRSGPDYPLASAGVLGASGSGSLTLLPAVSVTFASLTLGTPAPGMVEARYARPAVDSDVVGEPTVTITYRGNALPASTFVYAQVVDAIAGRAAGNQVTPIPVVLDGLTHTVTRKLEVIAIRAKTWSDLRLQIVPSTPIYSGQRSIGTIDSMVVASSLPVVDATRAAAVPPPAVPPPVAPPPAAPPAAAPAGPAAPAAPLPVAAAPAAPTAAPANPLRALLQPHSLGRLGALLFPRRP